MHKTVEYFNKQWTAYNSSCYAYTKRLHANVLTQIHWYTSMYTMYIRYATLHRRCTHVDTASFRCWPGTSAFFLQLTQCYLHTTIGLKLADEFIQPLVPLFVSCMKNSLLFAANILLLMSLLWEGMNNVSHIQTGPRSMHCMRVKIVIHRTLLICDSQ